MYSPIKLTLESLDNPVLISLKDLRDSKPFFNDSYGVILIKNSKCIDNKYKPYFLQDTSYFRNLLFNGYTIENQIEKYKGNSRHTSCSLLKLMDNWCVYVEKRHTWDSFESRSILIFISENKECLLDYFNKYFQDFLMK